MGRDEKREGRGKEQEGKRKAEKRRKSEEMGEKEKRKRGTGRKGKEGSVWGMKRGGRDSRSGEERGNAT